MITQDTEIVGESSLEQTPEEIETAAAQFGFVKSIQIKAYEDETGKYLQIEVETNDFASQHKLRPYDETYYEIVESFIYNDSTTIDVLDFASQQIGSNITPVVSRYSIIPNCEDILVNGLEIAQLPIAIQESLLSTGSHFNRTENISVCPLPITFGSMYFFFHELAHANDPKFTEVDKLLDRVWDATNFDNPRDYETFTGMSSAAQIILEKFAFEKGLNATRALFPTANDPDCAYLAMYCYEVSRQETLDRKNKAHMELVKTYDVTTEQAHRIEEIGLKYHDYIGMLNDS